MIHIIHVVGEKPLSIEEVHHIVKNDLKLELSNTCKEAVKANRAYLDDKLSGNNKAYYGINTGFGSLCDVVIDDDKIHELQYNLVVSHACGAGDLVPEHIVKLIMLLKIQNLALARSGARLELLERLVAMYNAGIVPEIFQLGSLGASGDLAPLAHLASAIIGVGHVYFKGERMAASDALEKVGLGEFHLHAKEGLALLNGTQFSTAYALHAVMQGERLLDLANHTAALAMDAFACQLSPLDADIHKVRNQIGQINTAASISELLEGSELAGQYAYNVQDPYSFRCVPQVHGASYDAIMYAKGIVEREINAVTDNPNVFHEEDKILSGGNFHAQPIALVSDFLAIALSELGSISERRSYVFLGGHRDLPPFLVSAAGLHSGMMILQYSAASIASQNKQLCTPASVDSIISCNGQEDHVSMAANAGTKLYKVVNNLKSLLAIEWIIAAQAKGFRSDKKSAEKIEKLYQRFRTFVPQIEEDTFMREHIASAEKFVEQWIS